MRINIATLFPEMCDAVINTSIIGRAKNAGKVDIRTFNIRDYTLDKHRNVDDTPYGGGHGMVMQTQPVYDCCKAIDADSDEPAFIVFTTAAGKVFDQQTAIELSKKKNLTIVCGHYEGIDERVIEELADMEISIGDYVLTGGELPALVVSDAIARMCDGVLASAECFEEESHFGGLLEYPHYTRPEVWHDMPVPDVLLTGHHKNIAAWRHEMAMSITAERRPDMLEKYNEAHKDEQKKK